MSPTLGTTLFPTISRTAICTFLHHEIFFSKIFSFGQFACLDQLAESVPNLVLWLVELAGEFVKSEVLQLVPVATKVLLPYCEPTGASMWKTGSNLQGARLIPSVIHNVA
jgi:hypothetical protein